MDAKIKDSIISCPECGTAGSFICTNCRHRVRFSLQCNGLKEGWEDSIGEPKQQGSGIEAPGSVEGDIMEKSIKKVTEEDILESEEAASRLKQVLFDEIKTSLQEDIKNAITEAVSAIKKDLLGELKTEEEPEAPEGTSAEPKEKEPGKETPGSGEVGAVEEPVKETPDSTSGGDKKEEAGKTDTPGEDVPEEQVKEEKDKDSEERENNKKIVKLKNPFRTKTKNKKKDFLESLELWEFYKEINK